MKIKVIIKVIVKDGDWKVFSDYIAFLKEKIRHQLLSFFGFTLFFFSFYFVIFSSWMVFIEPLHVSNTFDWIYDVQNTPFLVGKTFVL